MNLCNVRGVSSLYVASLKGHESTVKFLLDNGADVNLCTEDGTSPLSPLALKDMIALHNFYRITALT